MSDLISREKAINAVYGMVRPTGIDELPYEYAEGVINDLPSADVMECARAIKEYCKRMKKCDTCPFRSENFLGCSIGRPMYWDLPEGEKENERSDDK